MSTIDRVSGTVLVIFALAVIWESRNLPLGSFREPGPAYIPVLLALLLAIFGGLVAAMGGKSDKLASVGWTEWRHVLVILGACIFAAFGFERLGYRLTVLTVLVLLLRGLERQSWMTTGLFALGLAFGSFFLFHTILRVPLPLGRFGI
mgnify:CR=1 FL=1